MKIAIILPSLDSKAPILIAISLAESFSQKGHHVTLFYLRECPGIKAPNRINVKKISFFEDIAWDDFDVIHSHMLRPDAYIFLRRLLGRKFKSVTTIHNYVYPELENYYNRPISLIIGSLWNFIWSRLDILVVLTKDAACYYKNISFNKKIYQIYNGRDIIVNYDIIQPIYRKNIENLRDRGLYIVGSYCNLIKRKGVDILIRHVHRVPGSSLVIFGDGPQRGDLEELASNLCVKDRVIFFGAMPEAHQYNILFDVFAMPSRDEGFGLALIEAALHKKKIVCSNISVFKELFNEDSVNYFDINNESSIDEAIKIALAAEEKPYLAYTRAINYFTVNIMAESYLQVYEKLIGDSY